VWAVSGMVCDGVYQEIHGGMFGMAHGEVCGVECGGAVHNMGRIVGRADIIAYREGKIGWEIEVGVVKGKESV
jgi:hypothetical protein